MKKMVVILMFVTIISKGLGFLRDIILAYFYGVSNISDIYLISMMIPETIFVIIGTGIATSFVPIYSSIKEKQSVAVANQFTNDVINYMILLCIGISVLGLIFTVPLVKLFASGFDEESLRLTVMFTRISILGVSFTGLVYIFTGYLQIKDKFVMPALIGVPLNLIIMLSIMLSKSLSIMMLPIGLVIAKASTFILIVPSVFKQGYRYKPSIRRHDESVSKMFKLAVPIMLGVSVNQVNVVIDKAIASHISVGGISALNYANNVNLFIQGIFVLSVATVMYPLISKMAAEGNMVGLNKSVTESMTIINLLVIPSTVGLMVFAEPVVSMLFGRGAFDAEAIQMTSFALFFYSIGMVGFGLREVLSRTFYSMQDTRTPTINAAIAMVMNIILNFILARYLGIGGLALATSISGILCSILLIISLRKKIGPFGLKSIGITFVKITIASLVMGGSVKLVYVWLSPFIYESLALLLCIMLGVLIYGTLILFMKIKDVDVIFSNLKEKRKKIAS